VAGDAISNALKTKATIDERRRLNDLMRLVSTLGRKVSIKAVGMAIAEQIKDMHQARIVLVYQVLENGRSLLQQIGSSDDRAGRLEPISSEIEALLSKVCATGNLEYLSRGLDGELNAARGPNARPRTLIVPLLHDGFLKRKAGAPEEALNASSSLWSSVSDNPGLRQILVKLDKELPVLPPAKGQKRAESKAKPKLVSPWEHHDRRVKGVVLIFDRDQPPSGQTESEPRPFTPQMGADLMQYGKFAARSLWREVETQRVNSESSLDAHGVGKTLSRNMRSSFKKVETRGSQKSLLLKDGSWDAYRAKDRAGRGFLQAMQYDEWSETFLKKAMFVHTQMLRADRPCGLVSIAPSRDASRAPSPDSAGGGAAGDGGVDGGRRQNAVSQRAVPRLPAAPLDAIARGFLEPSERSSQEILAKMRHNRRVSPKHKKRKEMNEIAPGWHPSMERYQSMEGMSCLRLSHELRKIKGWSVTVENRLQSGASEINVDRVGRSGIRNSADWGVVAMKVARVITKSATVRLYIKPWASIFHNQEAQETSSKEPIKPFSQQSPMNWQSLANERRGTDVLSLTIGHVVNNTKWVQAFIQGKRGICGEILENHSLLRKRKAEQPILTMTEDEPIAHDSSVDIPKHSIGNTYLVTAPMFLPGVSHPIGTVQISRHGSQATEDGPYRDEERTTLFCFATNMALRVTTMLLQGTIGGHFDTLHSYQQSWSPNLMDARRKQRASIRFRKCLQGPPTSTFDRLASGASRMLQRAASSMIIQQIPSALSFVGVPHPLNGGPTASNSTGISAISTRVASRLSDSSSSHSTCSGHPKASSSIEDNHPKASSSIHPKASSSIEDKVRLMQEKAVKRAARHSLIIRRSNKTMALQPVGESGGLEEDGTDTEKESEQGREERTMVRWSRDPQLREGSVLTGRDYDGGPTMKKGLGHMSPGHQRLYLTLDAFRDQLDAEIAVIYLLDPFNPNVMVSVCQSHVYCDVQIRPPVTVKMGVGVTGAAFQTGEVICGDVDHNLYDASVDKPAFPNEYCVAEVVAIPFFSSDFYMRRTVNAGVQLIRQNVASEEQSKKRAPIMQEEVDNLSVLRSLLVQCIAQIFLESKACMRIWQAHLYRQLAECRCQYSLKFGEAYSKARRRHNQYLTRHKRAREEKKQQRQDYSDQLSALGGDSQWARTMGGNVDRANVVGHSGLFPIDLDPGANVVGHSGAVNWKQHDNEHVQPFNIFGPDDSTSGHWAQVQTPCPYIVIMSIYGN